MRAAVLAAAAEPGAVGDLRERLAAAGHDGASWASGERLRVLVSLLSASGDLVALGGASLSSNAMRYVDRRAWLQGDAGDGPDGGPSRGRGAMRGWRGCTCGHSDQLAWRTSRGGPDGPAGGRRTALAAHDTVDVGDGLRLLAVDLPAYEAVVPVPRVLTLLPKWDAWTMGYPLDGRGRFIDREVHDRVFDGDGNGLAMVLRGGRAIGAWAHRGERGRMAVDLDLFEPLRTAEREVLEAGARDRSRPSSATAGRSSATSRSVVPNRRRQRRAARG